VLRIDNRVADIFADGGDFKAAVSLLSDCLAVAESLDEGQAAFFAFRLGYMQRRQGQYAAALATLQRPLEFERLDRADEAQQIARDCLDMEITAASAFVQAKFHELWGDSLMDEDEDACHDAWARAVALYLVADALHDARRLSAEFLRDAGDDVQ